MYFICSTNLKSTDFEDMRNDFKLPNMQWLEYIHDHSPTQQKRK